MRIVESDPVSYPVRNASSRDRAKRFVTDQLPDDLFLGFDLRDPYSPSKVVCRNAGFDERNTWAFVSASTLDQYADLYAGVDPDDRGNEDFAILSDGERWVVVLRRAETTPYYIEAPRSLEDLCQWYRGIRDLGE